MTEIPQSRHIATEPRPRQRSRPKELRTAGLNLPHFREGMHYEE
jgi:hypothetical protein